MTDEIFSAVRFSFSATGLSACLRCFSGRMTVIFQFFPSGILTFPKKWIIIYII